jgi:hypothetical protein
VDTSGEEGIPTGRLRPGHRTVAGVVADDLYAALRRLQDERGLPSMSRAVGEALLAWAMGRAERPTSVERSSTGEPPEESTDAGDALNPLEAPLALEPWQEVTGRIVRITDEDRGFRVVLATPTGSIAVSLGTRPTGASLVEGHRVAILRTEGSPGWVVRSLG